MQMDAALHRELLAEITTTLSSRSTAELQNVLRMVQLNALSPGSSQLCTLSHYPRPADVDQLSECLDAGMTAISRRRLEGMPELAKMVSGQLLENLSLCARCRGLITQREIAEIQQKVNGWSGREDALPTTEEDLVEAWEVMGHSCRIATITGFIQGHLLAWMEALASLKHTLRSQEPVRIFSTDSPHRANALIYASYYPFHMLRGEHPDWVRMRNSNSLRVQGAKVAGDAQPTELLYDISRRLGMPVGIDIDVQKQWMQQRMDALVWIPKLIRQGCFATLMNVVGTSLFGRDFPSILMAGAGVEAGHKLDIDVSDSMLSVKASVKFSIRNSDLEVVGELPLCIQVIIKMHEDGNVLAFQMFAEIGLHLCPVNCHEVKERAAALLS